MLHHPFELTITSEQDINKQINKQKQITNGEQTVLYDKLIFQ